MLPPVDSATQAIFDTGHAFEQYAEALYPGGLTLGFEDYDQYLTLPERTTAALTEGNRTIFQGRFEHEQLTFICDIIQVVEGQKVDLIEIKSSTSAKLEHLTDLAFQLVVLEKCGYEVNAISVIHVNNQYVRNGVIDAKSITAKTDVTSAVKAIREYTVTKIDEALKVMLLKECPDSSPLYADPKAFAEWLAIYKQYKNTKQGSVYDLCGLNAKTLRLLQENGIHQLKDIPEDFDLTARQRMQVEALQKGSPIIQHEKIAEFLQSLEYPIYFYDYETLSSLVPYFDGLRPYQQLPFQYSLHILDEPSGKIRHVEYLHSENSNPAKLLTESLMNHIGPTGTLLAWNMGFEKNCNELLAQFAPEHAAFYKNINERTQDLMLPFAKLWYVDSAFLGSSSIKNVLPVLVPELSHKTLDISDGSTAQRLWMEAILDGKREAEKQQILDDLIEYCKLDTLAMVEIYKKLLAV